MGFYLGFRAIAEGGVGTWIARRLTEGSEYRYKSLGEVSESLDFNAAVALAEAWGTEIDRGVGVSLKGKPATVETACREYLEAIRLERPDTAHDAHMRFARTVYGDREQEKPAHPIAPQDLGKLREKHLRDWRDGLLAAGLSKSAANRTLTALRAALNYAVRARLAPAHLAFEVRCVTIFKNADRRRDVFLDQDQRRKLLTTAPGALRDLIEAAALTGARPGELVNAQRSAFDSRRRSLTLTGKTGTRVVPLTPAACALFERVSRDKLPTAYLLTREDGAQWTRVGWDRSLRSVVKLAHLPAGVCLYTLRHSFITEALLAGLATLTVAKMTGTSLAMIEKHYGHLVLDHAREQLAAVKLI
jgi:integrase